MTLNVLCQSPIIFTAVYRVRLIVFHSFLRFFRCFSVETIVIFVPVRVELAVNGFKFVELMLNNYNNCKLNSEYGQPHGRIFYSHRHYGALCQHLIKFIKGSAEKLDSMPDGACDLRELLSDHLPAW